MLRCLAAAALAVATIPVLAAAQPEPLPVFDVHLHAAFSPASVAAMRGAMDSLNVRGAVLIGTPGQLAEQARAGLLPSLTFPCEGGRMPNAGIECFAGGAELPDTAWLRAEIAAGRIRVLGELNAQYMGMRPDDPRLEPYYALAEELDVPIGVHLGIGPPGVAYAESRFPPRKSPGYRGGAGTPMLLEEVLVRHPRLRVYVMHAAWPFRDEMTYMLYMHPQLYVDVSVLQYAIPRAAFHEYLRHLVQAGFGRRIMFGSDGGPNRLREGIAAILEADYLTDEQKRDILYHNAVRFFRLEGG